MAQIMHWTEQSYSYGAGRAKQQTKASRALGPSFLGLPVVVAGAGFLVAVGSQRHAEALCAALAAEEEARLLVVRLGASPPALPPALCMQFQLDQSYLSFQLASSSNPNILVYLIRDWTAYVSTTRDLREGLRFPLPSLLPCTARHDAADRSVIRRLCSISQFVKADLCTIKFHICVCFSAVMVKLRLALPCGGCRCRHHCSGLHWRHHYSRWSSDRSTTMEYGDVNYYVQVVTPMHGS